MPTANPKLRSDLKISRQVQSEGTRYVVKDPITQEYYRFPEEEYFVIRLFDGTRSLQDVIRDYNAQSRDCEIDELVAKQFYDTLTDSHLFERPLAEHNLFLLEKLREQRKSTLLGAKGSLMYFRVSLLDPEPLLRRIYPHVRWVFARPFLVFAALCVAGAVGIIFHEYDRVAEGMKSIMTFSDTSPHALLGLWLTVIVVIFFHELGHAFTCKHFGGEVHEMGILMLFFMPCFFANVNDAWTFEKRYQKLSVTFAGGLVEFFIGSLATYLWFFLNPANPLSGICYQVMTVCALSSVMFNFNPLMKLDGYYAFSDFVSIPNLKAESAGFVKFILQRHLFRLDPADEFEAYTRREKWILFGYGIASIIYMTGVMLGLFMMARGMLVGALGAVGSLLSLLVGWKLFKGHIMKFKGFVAKLYASKLPLLKEHPVVSIAAAVILCGVVVYAASFQTLTVSRQCVLQPARTAPLHAGTSGFLKWHAMEPGRKVSKGECIGVLSNDDNTEKMSLLLIEKAQAAVALALARQASDYAAQRSEQARLDRNLREIAALNEEFSACTLRSPAEGYLVGSRALEGYHPYFTKGSEVVKVCSADSFTIDLSLIESETGEVAVGDRAEVRLTATPGEVLRGTVSHVAPVSSTYRADAGAGPAGVESEFMVRVAVGAARLSTLDPYLSGTVRIVAGKVRGVQLIRKRIREALRADLFF